jgi:hypothetical protein
LDSDWKVRIYPTINHSLSFSEADEITDEDLPVDMDILERVCNGEITLAQKPFQKTKFNPYGAVQRFKFDDTLFNRETTLFTSTVEAVIRFTFYRSKL